MSAASIADHRVIKGKVQIPKWGVWYASAELDGEHTLSGSVETKFNDLTLKGTVLASHAEKGRTSVRVVGGKGKWGNPIAKKDYTDDAGVRALTVLEDAARDAGESFDSTSIA